MRESKTTLWDEIMGWREQQERKHGPHCSAVDSINALTNAELLEEISTALEKILATSQEQSE